MEDKFSAVAVGVDIGTTSVKSVLCRFNSASKELYDTAVCKIESPSQENGEQFPFQVISSVLKCLKLLLLEKKEKSTSNNTGSIKVQRLAICGQMHGVILWSKDASLQIAADGDWELTGSAISNLITWQDKRCSEDFLSALPPSNRPLHSGYGCATLFWLQKHHPEEMAKYDCAGTIMDFFTFLLCDLERPVMSDQNAFSWGYFIPEENQWQCQLLKEAGFPMRLLPQVLPAGYVAGSTKFDLCGIIPSGTVVHVAAGDAQCSVMSTRVQHHQAVLNLGTSCQISIIHQTSNTETTPLSSHVEVWPLYSDLRLQVAASMNGGNVLEAFVTAVRNLMKDCGAEVSDSAIWSRLTSINLPDVEEYDQTLTINPTLYKERGFTAFTGASVLGVKPSNLTLDTLYICTCIGLVRNIKAMFPASALNECGISEIVCTGSLFSTHPILCNVVRYIYRDMNIGVVKDVNAAYGSVLLALASCSKSCS